MVNREISALIPSVRFLIDLTKQTFLNTSLTSPFFIALTIHPQKTAILLIIFTFDTWQWTIPYTPYLYPNPNLYPFPLSSLYLYHTHTLYHYTLSLYSNSLHSCIPLYCSVFTSLSYYTITLHYTTTLYCYTILQSFSK